MPTAGGLEIGVIWLCATLPRRTMTEIVDHESLRWPWRLAEWQCVGANNIGNHQVELLARGELRKMLAESG